MEARYTLGYTVLMKKYENFILINKDYGFCKPQILFILVFTERKSHSGVFLEI